MIDDAALRRLAAHEREVTLFDGIPRRLQLARGVGIEGHQENAAGAAIQPVHGVHRVTHPLARGVERGRAVIGPTAVHQHPRRFRQRQQMVVAVQQHRRYCCRMSDGKQRDGDAKQRGIEAENRDFLRYDQVDKQQRYRLAESADPAAEEFDDSFTIRTVDLGGAPETVAAELGAALREIGFAILVGHGIDTRLFDDAERAVFELFTQTPAETKLRFRAQRFGSVNQGYFPIKETSNIHPDLVEGWVFCRRAFDPAHAADFWPDAKFQHIFGRLCRANEALIVPIMQAMLRALGADPQLYDARLGATNFGLRLNYYPAVPAEHSGAGRLLGHEDTDLFTLLPAPRIEGLQVLNRRSNKWIRLDAPPGAIILNTGDYMQRISNDILPSTTHRVSRPRDPALAAQPRASFPMNVYLWENELLEVLPGLPNPKYEPIRAETFHTRITAKYYGDDYATG